MKKRWWITVSLIFLLGLTSCASMQEKGMMKEEKMMEAVDLWLKTPYSGIERHVRRLGKIDGIKLK